MAEHGHQPHGQASNDPEMAAHVKTYELFLTLTKWSVLGILAVAILLAIFRTHNGM